MLQQSWRTAPTTEQKHVNFNIENIIKAGVLRQREQLAPDMKKKQPNVYEYGTQNPVLYQSFPFALMLDMYFVLTKETVYALFPFSYGLIWFPFTPQTS